jgi:hypothetical protein
MAFFLNISMIFGKLKSIGLGLKEHLFLSGCINYFKIKYYYNIKNLTKLWGFGVMGFGVMGFGGYVV